MSISDLNPGGFTTIVKIFVCTLKMLSQYQGRGDTGGEHNHPYLLPFFTSPLPERTAGNHAATRTAVGPPLFLPEGAGSEPTTPPGSGAVMGTAALG
uniref:Uncharacterized protein n=1 Tax=Oryza punctata TaxID=4537 RepID=A0A0E0L8J2_ORYPU